MRTPATALLFCGLMLQLVVTPLHGHAEPQGATFEAQTDCAFCTGAGTEIDVVRAVASPLLPRHFVGLPTISSAITLAHPAGDAPARAPPLPRHHS